MLHFTKYKNGLLATYLCSGGVYASNLTLDIYDPSDPCHGIAYRPYTVPSGWIHRRTLSSTSAVLGLTNLLVLHEPAESSGEERRGEEKKVGGGERHVE